LTCFPACISARNALFAAAGFSAGFCLGADAQDQANSDSIRTARTRLLVGFIPFSPFLFFYGIGFVFRKTVYHIFRQVVGDGVTYDERKAHLFPRDAGDILTGRNAASLLLRSR